MSVLPRKTPELIAFCQARIPVWTANADAIGLSDDDVLAFTSSANGTNSTYAAQVAAAAAAKAATEATRTDVRELRRIAGDCVRRIRLYASNQAKPGEVYALAQIPAPQNPSTMPPPGTPGDFRAILNPDGSLTIAWKCTNPPGAAGTVYSIRRRIGGVGAPFEFIGAVGIKKFTDHDLPAINTVLYQVQAQRGSSVGLASTPFTVQFGTGGGGMTITAQYEGGGNEDDAKLAA